ncbi:MAG: efflux RND transporter periplasmic adaptor subunit [Planctomycetes bacterium]|nr:efflux RND transporter periplasmic adaptor subunit [Planctomycetota bacterium]
MHADRKLSASTMPEPPAPQERRSHWLVRLVLGGLLPLIVIGAAGLGALHLVNTAPRAPQRPPKRSASLVQVRVVQPGDQRAIVNAMGTVIAAKEVVLQPQVAGKVLELSADVVPGGHVQADTVLVKIEPRDYEIAVQEARSRVAQAEYELKIEQGHQDIARREWELLGVGPEASELDRELALRRPHLAKANAALAAARGALEKAELNLARTTIRAPFNGVIMDKHIDVGAQVTMQSALATLVGTDEFWVQVSVPVSELRWITVPKTTGARGPAALVQQHPGAGVSAQWTGEVVRLLSDLEPDGRMARLLVSVPDPLGLAAPADRRAPLLIGSYVDVEIAGHLLPDVFTIGRSECHDGNTIWIMDDEDKLEIRPIEIIFRGRDDVFVRIGLTAGERLVTSDLAAPVAGMPMRLASDKPDERGTDGAGGSVPHSAMVKP